MKRLREEFAALAPAHLPAPRTRRMRRVVLSLIVILLLLVVGAGGAYLVFLNHTFTANLKHEALLPTPSSGDPSPADGSSSEGSSTAVSSGKAALNILLIGSDSKTSIANGRSDVIILMHISGDPKKVYLVHFPRDMYVNVPGHGKDKINAAYAYGGSQLLVRTLQNLVGVSPNHVVVVGFEGFAAMTDAVGGVDVYAQEASVDEVYNQARTEKWYNTVHVGINHLGGQAALGFVRQRYQLKGGDVSRGIREQEFLQALLLKVLGSETLTSPKRFAALVSAVARNLTVDNAYSISDIYSQALSMRNLRSEDIVFVTAPISGSGTTPAGAWIFFVDEAKMVRLSNALRTDKMSSYTLGK